MSARREIDAGESFDGADGRVDERLSVGGGIWAVQRLGPGASKRHKFVFAFVAYEELYYFGGMLEAVVLKVVFG